MVHTQSEKRTLRDDQIRVSETAINAADVLRSSKPFLEAALRVTESGRDEHIEVPAEVFRDLVAILAAEVKRANAYTAYTAEDERRPRDSDWNPFKGIDISWL
ncbi:MULTISPECIES: hypothetical protein [unclassified Streptomyces]|uniref:hypothetical protein n=1 Tax=unclassified Streptomyces TaxID=2593676 RepID=UPI000938AED1|nr:hypothetical protein [Streptomyces sp. TSRI0281]OKI40121.1 hypothetical protein A6A29_40165 [Streptomyces sp. TSRI0281]